MRANGKMHAVAINNVKNKLLRIIVALVKKHTFYDPDSYKILRNRWLEKYPNLKTLKSEAAP